MNKYLVFILCLCTFGCRTPQTITTYEKIVEKDTIIIQSLPKEVINTVVMIDTVFQPIVVETSISKATVTKKGNIIDVQLVNKDSIKIETKYIEVEKYVDKTIIKKEIPSFVWWVLTILLVVIILLLSLIKIK